MTKMRSIMYDRYGGPEVLYSATIDKPKPSATQIMIRVISSSVTAADWHLRKADPFMARMVNGFFSPKNKVLGQEFSGEVVETGASVSAFQKGDMVFGSTGMKTGAYSEYITVEADSVVTFIPDGTDAEKVATVPIGALTAMYFLNRSGLSKGMKVLVNGASGSVGSYAVQIAKAKGAEVTGICSTSNVEMVKAIGADEVIDYKKTDITSLEQKYDIIFDTVGKLNFNDVKRNLTETGYFTSTAFNGSLMIQMMMNSFRKGKKVFTGVTNETKGDLECIREMLSEKKILPVIDKMYTMEEIQEAHQYVESGHKRGNVILKISDGGNYA